MNTPTDRRLRTAVAEDGEALAELYNHYVLNSITTFEVEPLSGAEMGHRVVTVQEAGLPWLVAELDGKLQGYSCAVRWKARAAYRQSCESTVYLAAGCEGQGLGSALYRKLLDELTELGIHAVLAGIALPNEASVGLHESMGFSKVAHLSEVGRKFDRWIDVGYWQQLL